MGRHSSESSDDYSTRRRRSRSRSESRGRRQKKQSKRSHRSSPRGSNSGPSSRSVSKTHDRGDYRKSRSRSRSYDSKSKGHRTERSHKKSSKSIRKYRHSSPRSTSRRRSRSRNRDRPRSKKRSRSKNKERSRRSPSTGSSSPSMHTSKAPSKGTQDKVSQAELAERKLQMALRAAAAADETLKAQGVLSSSMSRVSMADQQRRTAAIDSINNDQFVQNSFKSTRSEIPLPSDSQVDASHSGAMFSSSRTPALHGEGTSSIKSGAALTHPADKDSIMHPNLYIGADEKMERWKLYMLEWRKRKQMESSGIRA